MGTGSNPGFAEYEKVNSRALRKNPERNHLDSGKRENPERNNLECKNPEK